MTEDLKCLTPKPLYEDIAPSVHSKSFAASVANKDFWHSFPSHVNTIVIWRFGIGNESMEDCSTDPSDQ